MKRIILLIFFLSVYLVGNELKSSIESQYKVALRYYKEKNFDGSYEILSKLYLSKLSDAKLNFYLGRSAYETGHYEIALASFERVEMLDSSNIRNKLEMARTYFMLKMYEESELLFKEVLHNPNIPQNVRTNIELYLSKVSKVQEKSFTYASVDLDLLYDSNVNYGSLDSIYNISVGTLPAQAVESDFALQLNGDVTNIYDIGDKNGFAIKNKLKLFVKFYSDLHAYNTHYLSYTPSILYKETKYLAEFALNYDILYLGSSDYLHTLSFIPRFEYSHTNSLKSISHIKYQTKTFQQTAQSDLDSKHYELAYSLQEILSPRSYIQGNIILLQEKKEQGSRDDVDYREYRVSGVYANQLSSLYSGELFAEYRGRNYSDYSTLFASKREDKGIMLAGTFNVKLDNTLRVHLKMDYHRVDSNQGKYAYEKYTITTGINKKF